MISSNCSKISIILLNSKEKYQNKQLKELKVAATGKRDLWVEGAGLGMLFFFPTKILLVLHNLAFYIRLL